MVSIPDEAVIRGSLQPGAVYYFSDTKLTSVEPHYFIVLNIDPHEDALLLLVVSSSKIDRVKTRNVNNNPNETLIEITPADYTVFTVDSIVDCNSVLLKTKEDLIKKVSSGQLTLKDPISNDLLSKLRAAVLASKSHSDSIKRILDSTI